MPKRWERDKAIAARYMENVCAEVCFGLATINGDIVLRKKYSGAITERVTVLIVCPPDFLHALTKEGFVDDVPTPPVVYLVSHHDRWERRLDGHILSDWSLCLFVPGECPINFRDFHSLKQLIEVIATVLLYQIKFQALIVREKATGERAVWLGPQRSHGLLGYIEAIKERGGMRDDELCNCGKGLRFDRCHKTELADYSRRHEAA